MYSQMYQANQTNQSINGFRGIPLQQTQVATSIFFTGSVGYSIATGFLPDGLTLNVNTGFITGVPMKVGTYYATISAKGAISGIQSVLITFVIANPSVVSAVKSVNGLVGSEINVQVVATSYIVGLVSYTITSGTLPFGLVLNRNTGVVSGVPTNGGKTNVVVTIKGGISGMENIELVFFIAEPMIKPGNQIINANLGVQTSSNVFISSNLIGSVSYSVSMGILPPGLALITNSGAITGTPTSLGSYTVTITAKGATSGIANAIVTFVITNPQSCYC